MDVDDIEVTYKSAPYTNVTSDAKITYYGIVASDLSNKTAIIANITGTAVNVVQDGGATAASETGYALAITLGTAGDGAAKNYEVKTALNTGKLFIKQKEVKLKAKNAEKGPKDADPKFELVGVTVGGTVALEGTDYLDASTVTFERANAPESEVGKSYDITPNVANAKAYNGTGDEKKEVTSNYKFVVDTEKGKLNVNKAALTITIKDQYKYYGDDDPATIANPVKGTNYIVTNLVDGDEISSITLKKSWSAEKVGTYVLDATVEYTGADHYSSVTIVPGTFEIKKAVLTATLPIKNVNAAQSITDAEATLTTDGIVITGFKKGETVADTYTLALKAGLSVDGEDKLTSKTYADGYTVTLKDPIYDNYTFMNGTTETKTVAGKLIVGTGDTDALELSDAADNNFTKIQAANGETKTVKITLNRAQTIGGVAHNWKKGIWNCMVLPFKTNARQISNALGYAIVNVVNPSETTEGNVKFKLEMLEDIPANTPIFVKTDNDFTGEAKFVDVQIEAPESAYPSILASSEAIGYKFVGAYTKKTITGNNEEHLRWRLGDNNAWNKIGNGSSATWDIVPFNAYMDLGATAGAREIIFTFEEIDGTTTSIRSIDIDNVGNAKVNANGWYTLGGVKLNGAPTQKGVYIQDGKKVVIK